MPYFFILPAYIALAFVLIASGVAVRYVPRWKFASAYLIGGALGTLPGFVIANVIVMLSGVIPVILSEKITLPHLLQQIGGFVVAGILLIGPFIASAVGIAGGFFAGVYIVFRKRSKND